jgi:hypothetical protein
MVKIQKQHRSLSNIVKHKPVKKRPRKTQKCMFWFLQGAGGLMFANQKMSKSKFSQVAKFFFKHGYPPH